MDEVTIPVINGKFLYYAFVAGGNQIISNQAEVNRINVFPVNDKDTGTNLASTIRTVIDNIKPSKSYKQTVSSIADAALVGARGNSGVIFAQFLYGLNRETQNKTLITLADFAESVSRSIPYIYNAIANPVEGTMLTVIRDWSDFLNSRKESLHDFKKVMIDSLAVVEKSLQETTSKLKVLNKAGVVDAGAKGFVLFIKGVIDFIKHRNIRGLVASSASGSALIHEDATFGEEITHRYCSEAIIKNLTVESDTLKKTLSKHGDSIVVAGSSELTRIHVHTNYPDELFDRIKEYGTITYQKVDDMVRQHEISKDRKWNIALVSDSTCDLSEELIDKYQIHIAPVNISFGESSYLDKVTIKPRKFYDLLETEREFPKTSQINEQVFINMYSQLAAEYDAIIAIHLTDKFSGTYSNSKKAGERIAQETGKPVHVINSRNLSGALGLLVLKAAQSIEAGMDVESIVREIEADIERVKIYVSVKDLKHMIRGGRVTRNKGMVAKMLGINPIVSMDKEGNSLLFGSTFGQKNGLKKIYRHIDKLMQENTVWNYILLHAHNLDDIKEVEKRIHKMTGKAPVAVVDISPVIGMHAGNGAIAVSLLFNN